MENIQNPNSVIFGGICGIAGTILYILASFLPLHQNLLYIIAMSWPILSIIFVYSIYKYVAYNHQTFVNQLSVIFALLGFTIVACMISIQLAVKFGINEYISNTTDNRESFDLILKAIRLVDHGLDVAWDLFIGTSLLFLFAAIKGHSKFRLPWAIPALILGIVLIILNAYAFPWPPNTVGLIDIGPLIGLFIIAISIRLILLGVQLKRDMKNI